MSAILPVVSVQYLAMAMAYHQLKAMMALHQLRRRQLQSQRPSLRQLVAVMDESADVQGGEAPFCDWKLMHPVELTR